MRLINAKTLELVEFFTEIPEYAILSHTWGGEEVSFQEWGNPIEARKKAGFAKIEGSCRQALRDGHLYVWVDTNCIDKTSSSELSEAINSMFAWYRDAEVCYVYLEDVPAAEGPESTLANSTIRDKFRGSRWFTRGWTLQELIAPAEVVFYSQQWTELGRKGTEAGLINQITGIDRDYLRRPETIHYASISKRMSWLSKRTTTRVEDIAYCMLGIFDIHMALLYGERGKAFLRLQEEIIKVSNDQTIFCWQSGPKDDEKGRNGEDGVPSDWRSILAPNPRVFSDSSQYFPRPVAAGNSVGPYSITNYGLGISVPVLYTAMGVCAILEVGIRIGRREQQLSGTSRVMVQLHRVPTSKDDHYVRLFADLLITPVPPKLLQTRAQIFVDCRNTRSRDADGLVIAKMSSMSPHVDLSSCNRHVLLLVFNKPLEMEKMPEMRKILEFHKFDSAVEAEPSLRTDWDGEVAVRGSFNAHTNFQLFVGAFREDGGDVHWLVTFETNAKGTPGVEDAAHYPAPPKDLWVDGGWHKNGPLKSVASWLCSKNGAVVCFLELEDIETPPDSKSTEEDATFQHLRQIAHH